MTYVSPLLNILSKNVRKECKTIVRDFFEIEGELKLDTKKLYKINNQWYNTY